MNEVHRLLIRMERIKKDICSKKRNKRIKKVSKEVLDELVEVIYVSEDGSIDIKFKYQDEFSSLTKYIESEVAKENEKMENRNLSQAFI